MPQLKVREHANNNSLNEDLFTHNMKSGHWSLTVIVPQLSNIRNLHDSLGFFSCASPHRYHCNWAKAICSEKQKASRKSHSVFVFVFVFFICYWPELCQMTTSAEAIEGSNWINQTFKIVSTTKPWWKVTVIGFMGDFVIVAWGYIFLERWS